MRGLIIFIVLLLGAAEAYLLFSKQSVRIWRTEIARGEPLNIPGQGDAKYDALVCRYFDGFNIDYNIYRHAEDDVGGFSTCPWLVPKK
ncbi:MAG: hypothetical protein AAF216_13255 [Pseudomonadota bacterium]